MSDYIVKDEDGKTESVWPSAAQAIRAAKESGQDVYLHDDTFVGKHDDTSRSCPCLPVQVQKAAGCK